MFGRCTAFPLALTLVVLGSSIETSIAADTLILRTADNQPADYPTAEAITYMGDWLGDRSSGELQIKLYAGGQLGDR